MSRRYTADGDAFLTALAGRVDTVEQQQRAVTVDVSALRRGVADLTAELRRRPATGAIGGDDTQPDWVAVHDAETAAAWLLEVDQGRREVLPRHGLEVTAPCWSLHPNVVACLLGLLGERAAAYASDRPASVVDWHTRALPLLGSRIEAALARCVAERGHRENGRTHDPSDLDLASVAAWWVRDRQVPAAEALLLRPL